MMWVVAAKWIACKDGLTNIAGEEKEGVAIGLTPGLFDIKAFIDHNGKVETGPVWSYDLEGSKGSIVILSDAEEAKLGGQKETHSTSISEGPSDPSDGAVRSKQESEDGPDLNELHDWEQDRFRG